ncbi:DNA/RNA nuclease SfsA [Pelotomaculum propionicicum]|uniref:DNA/RNA nuclease SfsA n=1 Tax=Pelotomaculum propionicicum TaxID=258475 RepID=UPI003B81E365
MIYDNIRQGFFLDRPNRFIAHIEIDSRMEICHVKNTGRCRELLTHRAPVLVRENVSPTRKTKYDLISVYKGQRLINIDSSAPNKVFAEWLQNGGLFQNITLLKPEQHFGGSRFDFYVEGDNRKAFMEVKGVTLEDNGVVRFPDAPTQRGVRHLNELAACVKAGFEAYAVFIVQMKDVFYFEPNWATHRAFGEALRKAAGQGVRVLALDCQVTENSIAAGNSVEVRITDK